MFTKITILNGHIHFEIQSLNRQTLNIWNVNQNNLVRYMIKAIILEKIASILEIERNQITYNPD